MCPHCLAMVVLGALGATPIIGFMFLKLRTRLGNRRVGWRIKQH